MNSEERVGYLVERAMEAFDGVQATADTHVRNDDIERGQFRAAVTERMRQCAQVWTLEVDEAHEDAVIDGLTAKELERQCALRRIWGLVATMDSHGVQLRGDVGEISYHAHGIDLPTAVLVLFAKLDAASVPR